MTATLRLTVVALATLVCGLVGMGLSLLTSPFQADPNTTSGGWFFLFLAAADRQKRGNRRGCERQAVGG